MRMEAHVHITRARRGLNDCVSARRLPDGKVFWISDITLSDVTFAVQPAGLRRFRETGQKNVHAFIRGTMEDNPKRLGSWRIARYNPKVNDTFVDSESGDAVYSASEAQLIGTSLFYR